MAVDVTHKFTNIILQLHSTTIRRRINADGSVDDGFSSGIGPDQAVKTILIDENGKIIIGGEFVMYNEVEASKLVRLNEDGSIDEEFEYGSGANGNVQILAMTADNKILAGGLFTNYAGVGKNRMARIFNEEEEVLDIFENNQVEVMLYPNPFVSEVHIQSEKEVQEVLVYDVTGALVAVKTKQLNLSALSKGIYFMKIIWTDNSFALKKLIKK